jgi:purine-binding chemotaxis protein CheW
MDIAEIRKKAKAQKPSDDPVVESDGVVESAGQPESSEQEPESFDLQGDIADVEVEQAPVVGSDEAVAAVDNEMVTAQETSDGLDRLFAATEEFVLSTDEFNTDILETQGEIQAQTRRQYLAFHLSDEEYALDITQINEIIKVREFTDIPRAPEFVLGIISLRGVVVPVFDLRQRLNLGGSELMLSSRIVVCSLNDITVGLLVDSINQVINLVDEDVEPPPGVLSGLDREMVAGIGRYQKRMIILLNLPRVLDLEGIES